MKPRLARASNGGGAVAVAVAAAAVAAVSPSLQEPQEEDPRRARIPGGPALFQNEALRGLWRRNPGGGRLDGREPEVGPQLSNREKPLRDLTRVRKRAGPFQN